MDQKIDGLMDGWKEVAEERGEEREKEKEWEERSVMMTTTIQTEPWITAPRIDVDSRFQFQRPAPNNKTRRKEAGVQ